MKITNDIPQFVYDCSDCIFLGQSKDKKYDMYFCKNDPTIILRT